MFVKTLDSKLVKEKALKDFNLIYQTTKHMRENEIKRDKVGVQMDSFIIASCSHSFIHRICPTFVGYYRKLRHKCLVFHNFKLVNFKGIYRSAYIVDFLVSFYFYIQDKHLF